jgi:hypothetical protein
MKKKLEWQYHITPKMMKREKLFYSFFANKHVRSVYNLFLDIKICTIIWYARDGFVCVILLCYILIGIGNSK